MLQLQNTILEMIAKGKALKTTAERLCQEVERRFGDAACAVLMIDPDGVMRTVAAPSLKEAERRALDGAQLGHDVDALGHGALHHASTSSISHLDEPCGSTPRGMMLPGFRHCSSSPILNDGHDLLGMFALYYRDQRSATAYEADIVRQCTDLCAIAIERHQRVVERERRALTDALTGLPNRAAFNAALTQLDRNTADAWGLFILDLDNLKVVNDTFGHQAGDCLLQIASKRLAAAMPSGHVFRIGGDEFAMIITSTSWLDNLETTAEAILSSLGMPADCGGHVVAPRATIGGAVPTGGDRTAERVRQNADFALYHAKETGRGGFVRFRPGIGTSITRRLEAIRLVDEALRENRIDAHYQPVFQLSTGEIVGLEALCRIRTHDGFIAAARFHEATKDVHLSTELTARMMAIVADDVRAWLDMDIPFQHVGINVSCADLHGGRLETMLIEAFAKRNVPLHHVILEVTEAVYMDNGGGTVQQAVTYLRERGLRVALDDFGTGFASLTHLLTLPVDIIKIDKSFVDRLAPGSPGMAIVEGLVQIAGKLDMRVVAEGIETHDQARMLKALGCTLGQGHLIAPALDRTAVTRMLLERAQYRTRNDLALAT